MAIPRIGTFSNGPYKIKGFAIFGNVYGKIVESYYPMVHDVGDHVVFCEYHLPEDDDPQFFIVD